MVLKVICLKAEWAGYLKKAKSMNSERFNYWIDKIDFQNLRAVEIKKEFLSVMVFLLIFLAV